MVSEIAMGFKNFFIWHSLQMAYGNSDSIIHEFSIPEVLKEYAYILGKFLEELGLKEWDAQVWWDGEDSAWEVCAERELPGGSGLRKRFERIVVEAALVWDRGAFEFAWQLNSTALRALAKDILLLAEFSGKQVVVPERWLNDVDDDVKESEQPEYKWVVYK